MPHDSLVRTQPRNTLVIASVGHKLRTNSRGMNVPTINTDSLNYHC
jgi:hypothetical protein